MKVLRLLMITTPAFMALMLKERKREWLKGEVLDIMGVQKPAEMTGESLIVR